MFAWCLHILSLVVTPSEVALILTSKLLVVLVWGDKVLEVPL